jgi:hypothetical protein
VQRRDLLPEPACLQDPVFGERVLPERDVLLRLDRILHHRLLRPLVLQRLDALLQQQGMHGQLHRDEREDGIEILPGLVRLHYQRVLGRGRVSPQRTSPHLLSGTPATRVNVCPLP